MAKDRAKELRRTFDELKETYEDSPLVDDLTKRANKLLGRRQPNRTWQYILGGFAGVLALFVVSLNAMPERTETFEKIPVLGRLARTLTFVKRESHQYKPSQSQSANVMYEELR